MSIPDEKRLLRMESVALLYKTMYSNIRAERNSLQQQLYVARSTITDLTVRLAKQEGTSSLGKSSKA